MQTFLLQSTSNIVRLTGWNAIKSRVQQLGLNMSDEQIKTVTGKIKTLADVRPVAIDDADSIIRSFHLELNDQRDGSANAQPKEITKVNGVDLPETESGAQAVIV